MKKFFLILSSALVLGFSAFAQDEFDKTWFLEIKGGAGHTVGETAFTKLISPAASVSLGYQFTPVFGLRGDISGIQGKGAVLNQPYKFNYAQGALDATFDIANLLCGYKVRTVNPYLFAGIGAAFEFKNDEANALAASFPAENYLWDGKQIVPAGRLGAGLNFRINEGFSIMAELAENAFTDKFNSKVGDKLDHQINALVGVRFNLGASKRAAERAAAIAAAEAAAKAAAEKAAAEAAAKAAAEKAAAEKAAAEKAAAEAAAKAAAEKAAREAARISTQNVYFLIDKSDIRESEAVKIDQIITLMKTYPEAQLTVTGYADKDTGTAKRNMTLSQERAEGVAQAIIDAGIAKDRITVEYRGSEVNPYPTPEENRVAVCVTK